jgi:RNA polymerase sigma-70 factor, ECF subfamily
MTMMMTQMPNAPAGDEPISAPGDDFRDLLMRAKSGERDSLGELMQWYANYLTILAATQLDRRLRRRMNPSDIVQEAMLAAHRDFADFRGNTQGELLGWLRQILIHTLHGNVARHIKVEKRDVRREVSLDAMNEQLEKSACHLAAMIPACTQSPSEPMQMRERAVEFANQLSRLKPDYRDVIVYRILQGLSFDEIAERMDRTGGAVRMLWLRALEAFKTQGVLPARDH